MDTDERYKWLRTGRHLEDAIWRLELSLSLKERSDLEKNKFAELVDAVLQDITEPLARRFFKGDSVTKVVGKKLVGAWTSYEFNKIELEITALFLWLGALNPERSRDWGDLTVLHDGANTTRNAGVKLALALGGGAALAIAFGPGGMYLFGFAKAGIQAGSAAAYWQSLFAGGAATQGSIFSTLQSLSMTGAISAVGSAAVGAISGGAMLTLKKFGAVLNWVRGKERERSLSELRSQLLAQVVEQLLQREDADSSCRRPAKHVEVVELSWFGFVKKRIHQEDEHQCVWKELKRLCPLKSEWFDEYLQEDISPATPNAPRRAKRITVVKKMCRGDLAPFVRRDENLVAIER